MFDTAKEKKEKSILNFTACGHQWKTEASTRQFKNSAKKLVCHRKGERERGGIGQIKREKKGKAGPFTLSWKCGGKKAKMHKKLEREREERDRNV